MTENARDSTPASQDTSSADSPRLSRRGFLGLTGGILTAGSLAGLYGFVIEPNCLQVTRHRVPVRDLPPELESFTIAHITDAHFGPWRLVHDETLSALRRIEPDLIVATGDLVERPDALPRFTDFLRELQALDAELTCVLGNWEYSTGGYFVDDVYRIYDRLDVRLLQNEHVHLPESGIVIAGADDAVVRRYRPDDTFQKLPRAPFRLLLIHEPGPLDWQLHEAPTFDLCLAGHTHGGQITFAGYAPVTPTLSGRFVSGFYQTPRGRAYVSRGIGTTLPRIRMGCRPELPIFTLTRQSA